MLHTAHTCPTLRRASLSIYAMHLPTKQRCYTCCLADLVWFCCNVSHGLVAVHHLGEEIQAISSIACKGLALLTTLWSRAQGSSTSCRAKKISFREKKEVLVSTDLWLKKTMGHNQTSEVPPRVEIVKGMIS